VNVLWYFFDNYLIKIKYINFLLTLFYEIEPLNLEKQYDFYLDKCGIAKDKMHPVQNRTKKAFFGGVANSSFNEYSYISNGW